MNKQTSVYIDLVRFVAAFVVMASHLGGRRWSGGLGWQFVAFGGPAIDIFFVLSGYVIAFAVSERERDATTYAVNRAARIYSVVVPALVLTAILGIAGSRLRPDFDWGDRSPANYLSSLLFVNQVWFTSVQPGNDGPYWSLGYEVWYYLCFGCVVWLPGWRRWAVGAALLLVAGPRIALMLPVWLAGVMAYRLAVRRSVMSSIGGLLVFASTTMILISLVLWQLQTGSACVPIAFFSPRWRGRSRIGGNMRLTTVSRR